jgi:hypothetical protein
LPECRPGLALAEFLYPEGVRELRRLAIAIEAGPPFSSYAGARQPEEFWLTWLARDVVRHAGATAMRFGYGYVRDLSSCVSALALVDPKLARRVGEGVPWGVGVSHGAAPGPVLSWAEGAMDALEELWGRANER